RRWWSSDLPLHDPARADLVELHEVTDDRRVVVELEHAGDGVGGVGPVELHRERRVVGDLAVRASRVGRRPRGGEDVVEEVHRTVQRYGHVAAGEWELPPVDRRLA